MKALFIGTVGFSYNALKTLLDLGVDILYVFTKKESSFNSDFRDITPLCIKYNIPFSYVDNINDEENIKVLDNLGKIDIGFCIGWSQLLKKEILSKVRRGFIGYHPSPLPLNRGRHPLIWTLVLGLDKTSSTFFKIDIGVDSGDILSQEEIEISFYDTSKTLMEKLYYIQSKQIKEFIPKLLKYEEVYIQQAGSSNSWRKRTKFDGKIYFQMSSIAIHNLVRALTKPYPGATLEYNKEEIVVWKVTISKKEKNINYEFGKIIEVKNNIVSVITYDGVIDIIDAEWNDIPKVGEYLI